MSTRARQVVVALSVWEFLTDVIDVADDDAVVAACFNGLPGRPAFSIVTDVQFLARKRDGDVMRVFGTSESFEPMGCCWGKAPEHPAPHLESLRSANAGARQDGVGTGTSPEPLKEESP